MSKYLDRDQVLQNTRVRAALKNDGYWIHKSKQEEENPDKARMGCAVEATSVPVRQKSYFLSTAKWTEPQASTRELNGNGEAQPKKSVAKTTAENKREYVSLADQSRVKHSETKVANTSAVTGTRNSKDPSGVSAFTAKPKPQAKPSTNTKPVNTTHLEDAGVVSTAQPAQAKEETVKAVAKVVVESSPKTPVIITVTPKRKTTLQHNVYPATVPKSPIRSAAESAVRSRESKNISAAPADPRPKTRAEKIQPINNNVVKPSVAPKPKNAADRMMELRVKNSSEAGADRDKLPGQAIELTDALDVESPTVTAVPKSVEDPKQSHSEESKWKQYDNWNSNDKFQRPRDVLRSTHTLKQTRDGKAVCSYCDKIIDGNTKITLSDPLVLCHPDCLKCGICAKDLGNLLTPMFLHDHLIICYGCFRKAVKI
uniref:sciellin-like n=1 Tax=Monopterus albus TaxID=43700 RepID=UPI0009B4ABDA|nr:sciellin-like [Monopterus albus]